MGPLFCPNDHISDYVPVKGMHLSRLSGQAQTLFALTQSQLHHFTLGDVSDKAANRIRLPLRVAQRKLLHNLGANAFLLLRGFFTLYRPVFLQDSQIIGTISSRLFGWEDFIVGLSKNLFARKRGLLYRQRVDIQVSAIPVLDEHDGGAVVPDCLQLLLARTQSLLGLLALGNIHTRSDITTKGSIGRKAWCAAVENPAILSVKASQ